MITPLSYCYYTGEARKKKLGKDSRKFVHGDNNPDCAIMSMGKISSQDGKRTQWLEKAMATFWCCVMC